MQCSAAFQKTNYVLLLKGIQGLVYCIYKNPIPSLSYVNIPRCHVLTWGTRPTSHTAAARIVGGSLDKWLLPLYILHHLFNGNLCSSRSVGLLAISRLISIHSINCINGREDTCAWSDNAMSTACLKFLASFLHCGISSSNIFFFLMFSTL